MIMTLDELENTFIEEFEGAVDELQKGRNKNAVILFSKALFALCDLLIFLKFSKLPKNHTERFRILEEHFNQIYVLIDDVWNHYTNAYSKPILKETNESMKNAIKEINRLENFPNKIREVIGKL